MVLGSKIKMLRRERGLSARVLAEKVGINQQHVYALEAGRYDPSLSTARKIAEALGVPVAELFVEESDEDQLALSEYIKALSPEARAFLKERYASCYIETVARLAKAGLAPEDISTVGNAIVEVLRRRKNRQLDNTNDTNQ